MPTTEQTIQSNAFIGVETIQQILSDTNMTGSPIKTITSDAFMGQESQNSIDSDSVILVEQEVTLTSESVISPIFIFDGVTDLTVEADEELLVETDNDNPIPAAPTSLVAADTGVGDSVSLTWISTATLFNVFRKEIGPIFTKLNPIPIEETTYQAGNLTQGIPITFIVRAVNGLGQESSDSNEATATPTLNTNLERFSNPTWTVKIDAVIRTDAILSSVTLGFGSTFSTAVFSLPVDPRSGNPGIGSSIDIIVNSRLVFRGKISIRADIIDTGGGLRASYTCFSNITDLTTTTVNGTDVDMVNTTFNVFIKLPDGEGVILNAANSNQILSPFGLLSVPSVFPGLVDITDLTTLAAMELVLQKIGNFKVYHKMSTGQNFAYRFGSGGFSVRGFKFGDAPNGGNILSYNVQNSNQDVVKRVKVIGAPKQVRVRRILSNLDVGVDPDGRRRLIAQIGGKNIRDIQIFGFSRSKPIVSFNEKVQILLEDFDSAFSSSSSAPSSIPSIIDNSFRLSNSAGGSSTGDENTASEEKSLRPIITSIGRFSSQRQSIGARTFFEGKDNAIISINTVPKNWFTVTRAGNVERAKVGLEGGGTISVSVLLSYGWFPGTMEVEFTIDETKPFVITGSGTPSKSITDGQYQIVDNAVNGFDNEDDIISRMNARASNELARLQKEDLSGTITVTGDETLDLRSSVEVNGQRLEISGVTHNFGNGFTTTVELTNEPFFANIIVPPSLILSGQKPKESEKGRRTFLETFVGRELSEADNSKYLAAAKENIDKDTTERGPFSIWGD